MDPFVFPQRSAIGKRLPAEPAAVRPLPGVNAHVDLL